MNRARRWIALLCVVLPVAELFVACGGQSGAIPGDDRGDALACAPLACPTNEAWNAASCACEPIDEGTHDEATNPCGLTCPTGTAMNAACFCVPLDAGPPIDATPPPDAPRDVAPPDSPQDAPYRDADADVSVRSDAPPDGPPSDAPHPPLDGPSDAPIFTVDEGPPDSPVCSGDDCFTCNPDACGTGFEATPSCECIACSNMCPAGEQPAAGCMGCVGCVATCPAGFVQGKNCGCIPVGVEAGPPPPPPDAGGVTCLLAGYYECSAGSWCSLGVCPDGHTQYGCYCNQDGTATCQASCPIPPPCDIPGQGTCPYGEECVFGTCSSDASGTALVCSCDQAGGASCFTSPCSGLDGGPGFLDGGPPADGGAACLLEGYDWCAAGTFCQLGVCPDGTTPYGCTCNQDGTATCQLTCPLAKPCTIPGEGTCPYQSTCTFGSCADDGGEELSCYCGSGGFASCYTTPCNGLDGAVGGDVML